MQMPAEENEEMVKKNQNEKDKRNLCGCENFCLNLLSEKQEHVNT
jgi:flavin reductase (DIM6/NTAB) family NADH-FMN oxidoreductase RutF